MNKFEINELKASALTSVAHSVEYYISVCLEDIEQYQERVKQDTPEGELPDPDSYWSKEVKKAQERLMLWNEFAALLEKKLSK